MRHRMLTVMALFLLACASSAAELRESVKPSENATSFRDLSQHDGSSFERAIVIMATNERDGIAEEYRWLTEHYPNCRKRMQGMVQHEGRRYDILQITDAAEIERAVYFDITYFFGKR